MVTSNELKGTLEMIVRYNDKDHERLDEHIVSTESRLLHALKIMEEQFNTWKHNDFDKFKKRFYFWNGIVYSSIGVGAFFGSKIIENLLK